MKKFLCYITLLVLIVAILLPPALRMFYKDDDGPTIVDKYQLLTCTKDTYSIATSYKNEEPLNIKFKHLVDDERLSENNSEYALEYKLYSVLPNISNIQKEESVNNDNKMISYYIDYVNVNVSILTELSEYRAKLSEQKNYYMVRGYTCSIIE